MNINRFTSPQGASITRGWAFRAIFALACYGYINQGYGANLLQEGQHPLKTLGQAAMLASGFIALLLGPLAIKNRFVFGILSVLCVSSITTNFAVQELMADQMNRDTAIWLFAERHRAGDALALWAPTILKLLFLSVALIVVLRYSAVALREHMARRVGTLRASQLRAISVVAYLFIPLAMVVTNLRGGIAESNMIAFAINAVMLGDPEPRVLTLRPARPPLARNVVLLMDESTRPDTFNKIVSPSLPNHAINYLHSYAISGCSASSNALMRWGLIRTQGEVEDPRVNPSIWAYAKNAGMKTVLIDGQIATTRDTNNLILKSEYALIDEIRAMDVGIDTDMHIARAVGELTRLPGYRFIYVVLRGNHAPYAINNLPQSMKNLGGGVLTEYERSVAYTTKRLFNDLLADGAKDPSTILFYSSDHGQDLGAPVTHCKSRAPEADFEVPMVILPGPAEAWATTLRATLGCWLGGANHVNLRSTMVEAMGYAREDIEQEGFMSLAGCPDDRRMPRFLGNLPFVSAKGEKLRYEWVPFRNQRSIKE